MEPTGSGWPPHSEVLKLIASAKSLGHVRLHIRKFQRLGHGHFGEALFYLWLPPSGLGGCFFLFELFNIFAIYVAKILLALFFYYSCSVVDSALLPKIWSASLHSLFLYLYTCSTEAFWGLFWSQKVYITKGPITDTMKGLTPLLLIFSLPNCFPPLLPPLAQQV